MKKNLSLFAMLAMAVMTYAEAPVLGVDYEWKKVTSTMTEVPADFVEGVTLADVEDNNDFSSMYIYGSLPSAGEAFTLYDAFMDETASKTWSAILDDLTEATYKYPAQKTGSSEDTDPEPAAYEWVSVTATMTTVPADFYEGVPVSDIESKNDWTSLYIYGSLPEEGGTFSVFDAMWSETSQMTWTALLEAVADETSVKYPRSLSSGENALHEQNADATCTKKMVNGQLVIIKGDRKYNVLGSEIR